MELPGARSVLRVAPVALLLVAAALGCGDARPAAGPRLDRCVLCHGDSNRPSTALNPALPAAPPAGTRGETLPTQPAVGAHQAHLNDGPLSGAMRCTECHVVPADLAHAADPLQLTWGPLATHGNATPYWDPGALACSATYCHGNFPDGNKANAPIWTGGSGQAACGSCHGIPPPSPHPQNADCGGCHPGYTSSTVNVDLHVNGKPDFGGGGTGCASCHGYPPATGAHAIHVGFADDPASAGYGETSILQDLFPAATPASAPRAYFFGCGNCHPIDGTKHMDGVVEVELFDPAAPAGSLKALASPAAAYAGGSCSGVYCHSSGQEASSAPPLPSYATTPAWTSGTKLGCDGCHRNPPNHASGGPGAPDANGHLGVRDDNYVWGHFGGMPGPSLFSKHGKLPGNDAAPITCQTCHADTVDPANTGASGFYYLDTSGSYAFGGGVLDDACAVCHTGAAGAPAIGTGKVLPLRHVNGTREVVFDARASLPAMAWLPAPPNTPTRPYWVTNASPGYVPPTSGFDGTTTWSLTLGGVGAAPPARYDAATKTCSNVACHLESAGPVWGAPYNVNVPVGPAYGCCDCHRHSICGL